MTTRLHPFPAPTRRTALLAAAAVVVLLAATAAARADDRTIWKFDGGFYQNKGDGAWIESNAGATYKFREVDRNDDYIELNDAKRNVSVRLFADKMDMKNNVDYKVFKKLRDGHWGD